MSVEMFGPYRLLELIGRGGMGEVWRAADTRKNDRVVALKRLPAAMAADDDYRRRFRREAEVVAGLTDPHVIPIHDYGEIDGRMFIDMRLVDGIDLGTVLDREGPMPPWRAVEVIGQVAEALDEAHRAGLVHRDIKPSNILVTTRGGRDFAYLIDFGIVQSRGSARLTGTGQAVGTLAYMAPERFESAGDHRVDVYALGCVLHEALTGEPAVSSHSMPGYMHAHLAVPPPRPSLRRPGLPAALDHVVATAMAKDPGARYPRAGELAEAARRALPGVVPAPPPRPVTVGPPPPLPRPMTPPGSPLPAWSGPRTPPPYVMTGPGGTRQVPSFGQRAGRVALWWVVGVLATITSMTLAVGVAPTYTGERVATVGIGLFLGVVTGLVALLLRSVVRTSRQDVDAVAASPSVFVSPRALRALTPRRLRIVGILMATGCGLLFVLMLLVDYSTSGGT